MSRSSELWKNDPIAALMRAHFPELNEKTPEGKAFARLSLPEQDARRNEAEAFRQSLLKMPEADRQQAIAEGKKVAEDHFQRWRAEELAKPFYERVSAEMEQDYWARMAFWSLEEATALSFGKDPREVNRSSLQSDSKAARFLREFEARFEILRRAEAMGQLREETGTQRFLQWIDRTGFPMPDSLLAAAKAIHGPEVDWKAQYFALKSEFEAWRSSNKEDLSNIGHMIGDISADIDKAFSKCTSNKLGLRERESFLKMIIAMAVKGYAHNPKLSRTTTASEIASDLAQLGLSLSDDTIRKFLQEARDLLPPPETEQKS